MISTTPAPAWGCIFKNEGGSAEPDGVSPRAGGRLLEDEPANVIMEPIEIVRRPPRAVPAPYSVLA